MSRSYKKNPIVKCERSCKFGKRQSNKKIRKLSLDISIPKGSHYQKFYNSAEVCDGKWMQRKSEAEKEWYDDQYDILNNVHPWKAKYNESLEQALINWKTFYKNK